MVDGRQVVPWPKENIPDADQLFMRVHKNLVKDGAPIPYTFRNHGEGMSTDWNAYSTAKESRLRARKPPETGVIEMNVGTIKLIPWQTVEHKPLLDNRAHTEVEGKKDDEEVRLKFTRIYTWVIQPDSPIADS